jgi:alanine dehydrogenase
MKIGIPKEIKDQEGRVALTPAAVGQLVSAGHEVTVETGAGSGSGFTDAEYLAAGASLGTAEQAWDRELVIKVKEPLPQEYAYLRQQMLFTFLHLAGVPKSLTETLLERGTTGIAYETVEDDRGGLPLLKPMSAIAGNMAALIGAYYLARPHGGKGVQLGRIQGTRHGRVLVIGDGIVGYHAASSAHGLGAEVVMLGLDAPKGAAYRQALGEGFTFLPSSPDEITRQLPETDLLVGAVLRRGAKADYVVSADQIRSLRPGSVVVDVSIDQGGCIATSHPTSHSHPIYVVDGVTHYCVTNMPGAFPRTATLALTDAVLPYALKLADHGLDALRQDPGFAKGFNTFQGQLTLQPAAAALDLLDRYQPVDAVL